MYICGVQYFIEILIVVGLIIVIINPILAVVVIWVILMPSYPWYTCFQWEVALEFLDSLDDVLISLEVIKNGGWDVVSAVMTFWCFLFLTPSQSLPVLPFSSFSFWHWMGHCLLVPFNDCIVFVVTFWFIAYGCVSCCLFILYFWLLVDMLGQSLPFVSLAFDSLKVVQWESHCLASAFLIFLFCWHIERIIPFWSLTT